jgi:hypothetical protein
MLILNFSQPFFKLNTYAVMLDVRPETYEVLHKMCPVLWTDLNLIYVLVTTCVNNITTCDLTVKYIDLHSATLVWNWPAEHQPWTPYWTYHSTAHDDTENCCMVFTFGFKLAHKRFFIVLYSDMTSIQNNMLIS